MSTDETTRSKSRPINWAVPGLSVALGIGYLVAGVLGDHTGFGIFGLCLMVGLAVVLLLVRGRSETVQGLLDRRDERINQIDMEATAAAGGITILAIIIAVFVQIARGDDPMPYAWLGALAGVAYLVALVVKRVRG
jgi:predicted histidine transporter YuiF (NhaC family)